MGRLTGWEAFITRYRYPTPALLAESACTDPWQTQQVQQVLLHYSCNTAASCCLAAAAGGRCLQMPCQVLWSRHDKEAAPK